MPMAESDQTSATTQSAAGGHQSDHSAQARFGMSSGVFTPCVLIILDVVMFVRSGFPHRFAHFAALTVVGPNDAGTGGWTGSRLDRRGADRSRSRPTTEPLGSSPEGPEPRPF